jgi:hypothetical protein
MEDEKQRRSGSLPESAFDATINLHDLSDRLKSRIIDAIKEELDLGDVAGYDKVTYEKPANGGYKKVVHEKDTPPFTKNIMPGEDVVLPEKRSG